MGNCMTKQKDYILTAEQAVGVLSGLATTTTAVMVALNNKGVDTTSALEIMKPIEAGFEIAEITTDIAIKLPKSFKEIKDMDGDGDIDSYDLVLTLTSNVDDAQRILVELRKAGVPLDDVEKVFDSIKLVANTLRDTVPPPPPKKGLTLSFNAAQNAALDEVVNVVESAEAAVAKSEPAAEKSKKVKAKKLG